MTENRVMLKMCVCVCVFFFIYFIKTTGTREEKEKIKKPLDIFQMIYMFFFSLKNRLAVNPPTGCFSFLIFVLAVVQHSLCSRKRFATGTQLLLVQ